MLNITFCSFNAHSYKTMYLFGISTTQPVYGAVDIWRCCVACKRGKKYFPEGTLRLLQEPKEVENFDQLTISKTLQGFN